MSLHISFLDQVINLSEKWGDGFLLISLLDLQNALEILHGGTIASMVELLSIACAKTVVADDKELFLGEISVSYFSGAPTNVSSVYV